MGGVVLGALKVAASPGSRDACKELARNWRLRRDVRDSYVTAARKVEQESSLGQIEFIPGTVTQVETFSCLERALLRHVEDSLLEGATHDLLDLATSHQSRFWSEVTPTIQRTGRCLPPPPKCCWRQIGSPRP